MRQLITRARYGWTWVRVVYVLIGVAVISNAAPHAEWIGVLLGAYLVSMGLFAIGCAGGNCAIPESRQDNVEESSKTTL